jgi:hypothetical protein
MPDEEMSWSFIIVEQQAVAQWDEPPCDRSETQ